MYRPTSWLVCALTLACSPPCLAASPLPPDADVTAEKTAPALPQSVHGWKLRALDGTPIRTYGHKNRDLTDLVDAPSTAYLDATGNSPAAGLIFVTEGTSDAKLLVTALQDLDPEDFLPEDMGFGDEISLEQALGIVPIPLPRGVAAGLLEVDPSDLEGLGWFLAVPSASSQKRAMKRLIKQKMKEEEVNFAVRILIRPFLGKIVGITAPAMQMAGQAMLIAIHP